mgnify:CR=1 FL=1
MCAGLRRGLFQSMQEMEKQHINKFIGGRIPGNRQNDRKSRGHICFFGVLPCSKWQKLTFKTVQPYESCEIRTKNDKMYSVIYRNNIKIAFEHIRKTCLHFQPIWKDATLNPSRPQYAEIGESGRCGNAPGKGRAAGLSPKRSIVLKGAKT